MHPDGAPWSINLEISSDATLRELKLRDLLLNAAAESRLWRLIRADLSRQISEAYASDPRDPDWIDEQLAAGQTVSSIQSDQQRPGRFVRPLFVRLLRIGRHDSVQEATRHPVEKALSETG